jgi:F0F1-type ATP synthase assembly protein I
LYKLGRKRVFFRKRAVTIALPMQAASPSSFDPAGAGGVLLAALLLCIGLGVLIGWAAGSAGIGALVGAIVGILAGIGAVYRRYRNAF